MASPVRLPNNTIASLRRASLYLDRLPSELEVVNAYFQRELTEAELNMDRRRKANVADAAAALARITSILLVLERILEDARRGRFADGRYPRP